MIHNKIAYNRYFVAPLGQDMVEGTGDYRDNKWGFKFDDGWFKDYMYDNYKLEYGTIECDEQARKIFMQAVTSDPLHYLYVLYRRIPQLFFPSGLWTNGLESFLHPLPSPVELLKTFFRHPAMSLIKCLDFAVARLFYIEILLLLGWLGLGVMFYEKKYFEALFLASVFVQTLNRWLFVTAPIYALLSHWILAFPAGYFIITVARLIQKQAFFRTLTRTISYAKQ